MKRRQILVSGSAGLAVFAIAPVLLGGRGARAEEAPVTEDDRILGQADAPITIIEYASLTCPHCARFHQGALQTIKRDWIEPGKARLVYRDYPLDGLALRAAALAQCIEGDSYFGFLDALFRGQLTWARASDPSSALAMVARLAGIDRKTFDACISDTKVMDRILKQQAAASKAFGIQSTPTFLINGAKVEGALDTGEFVKLLVRAESQL
jgi:protein-disulfide isomerase